MFLIGTAKPGSTRLYVAFSTDLIAALFCTDELKQPIGVFWPIHECLKFFDADAPNARNRSDLTA
jgi:hypothetical protein